MRELVDEFLIYSVEGLLIFFVAASGLAITAGVGSFAMFLAIGKRTGWWW